MADRTPTPPDAAPPTRLSVEPCRFGYEEHDGARYCHEHGGFLEAGVRSRSCDRALVCPLCDFNAKTFEPRPEKQWGAHQYHIALHESGRVLVFGVTEDGERA